MEKKILWVAFMISLSPFTILQIAKHHVFFYINELTLYDHLLLIWLPVPLR